MYPFLLVIWYENVLDSEKWECDQIKGHPDESPRWWNVGHSHARQGIFSDCIRVWVHEVYIAWTRPWMSKGLLIVLPNLLSDSPGMAQSPLSLRTVPYELLRFTARFLPPRDLMKFRKSSVVFAKAIRPTRHFLHMGEDSCATIIIAYFSKFNFSTPIFFLHVAYGKHCASGWLLDDAAFLFQEIGPLLNSSWVRAAVDHRFNILLFRCHIEPSLIDPLSRMIGDISHSSAFVYEMCTFAPRYYDKFLDLLSPFHTTTLFYCRRIRIHFGPLAHGIFIEDERKYPMNPLCYYKRKAKLIRRTLESRISSDYSFFTLMRICSKILVVMNEMGLPWQCWFLSVLHFLLSGLLQ